jgi:hypothetical protein
LRRLVREGKTLAKVRDPGIVEVYDVGLGPDQAPYLLMELVDGEDLSQRLARGGPLGLDEAVALMADILGTLQVIHDAGVVHRDIKPSNFMLSSRGVRVVDFGIALSPSEGTRLTRTIDRMGTPDFMAPEQWTGEATPRSDLFAAGRLLFTLLAGHPPKKPNDRPSSVATAVPATVDDVYAKATAPEPADRYASAHEMAVALEAAVEIARRSEREPIAAQALTPSRIADVMDRVQRSFPTPIAQAFAHVPLLVESGGGSLLWNLFRAVEETLRYLCATQLAQLQEPDERLGEILDEVMSAPRFGSWTALSVRGETLLRRGDRILPRNLFARLDTVVEVRNQVAHAATTSQDAQMRARALSCVAEFLEDLAFLEQEPLFLAHVAPWTGDASEQAGALRAMGAAPRAWKVERVEVQAPGAYTSSGGRMVRLHPFCLGGPTLHDIVVFAGGLPRTEGRFQYSSSYRMSTDELNDRRVVVDLHEALRRLGYQPRPVSTAP